MAINLEALKGKTPEELLAIIAAMDAQPARKLGFKVSDKGALSIYGMGKFPTTLYASQWERIFEARADIEAFMKANAKLLTRK